MLAKIRKGEEKMKEIERLKGEKIEEMRAKSIEKAKEIEEIRREKKVMEEYR